MSKDLVKVKKGGLSAYAAKAGLSAPAAFGVSPEDICEQKKQGAA